MRGEGVFFFYRRRRDPQFPKETKNGAGDGGSRAGEAGMEGQGGGVGVEGQGIRSRVRAVGSGSSDRWKTRVGAKYNRGGARRGC